MSGSAEAQGLSDDCLFEAVLMVERCSLVRKFECEAGSSWGELSVESAKNLLPALDCLLIDAR